MIYLDSSGKSLPTEGLENITTYKKNSSKHVFIPHVVTARKILDTINQAGHSILSSNWVTNNDGLELYGSILLTTPFTLNGKRKGNWCVTVKASNGSRTTLVFYFGIRLENNVNIYVDEIQNFERQTVNRDASVFIENVFASFFISLLNSDKGKQVESLLIGLDSVQISREQAAEILLSVHEQFPGSYSFKYIKDFWFNWNIHTKTEQRQGTLWILLYCIVCVTNNMNAQVQINSIKAITNAFTYLLKLQQNK